MADLTPMMDRLPVYRFQPTRPWCEVFGWSLLVLDDSLVPAKSNNLRRGRVGLTTSGFHLMFTNPRK